jgi:glutaredoxin
MTQEQANRKLSHESHPLLLKRAAKCKMTALQQRKGAANIMEALRVYWRPGCSSCVKVKEFLSQLGVEYESVNVSAQPEAMDELRALGVRTVPVVTRGRDYVFAQALEDVSRFVGREVRIERLPEEVLIRKWLDVLEAAQRHVMQIPAERLQERRNRRTQSQHPRSRLSHLPDPGFVPAGDRGRRCGPDFGLQRGASRRGAHGGGHSRLRRARDRALAPLGVFILAGLARQDGQHVLRRAPAARAARALDLALRAARAPDHRRARAFRDRARCAPDPEDYAGLPMPVGVWE